MTLHCFVAGELIRDPERKIASNGNAYATALVRAGDEIVSVTAFDAELAERLACLKKGDPVAASGRLQARPYTDKNGESRAGLSVTATDLMAAPGRRTTAKPKTRTQGQAQSAEAAPFDDPLDF